MKKLFILLLALGATQAQAKNKAITVKNTTPYPIDFTLTCEAKRIGKKLGIGQNLTFTVDCTPKTVICYVHFDDATTGQKGLSGIYDIGLTAEQRKKDKLSFTIETIPMGIPGIPPLDIKVN